MRCENCGLELFGHPICQDCGWIQGSSKMIPHAYNDEYKTIVYELARSAVTDSMTYDTLAEKLDISDEQMKAVQEHILEYLGYED